MNYLNMCQSNFLFVSPSLALSHISLFPTLCILTLDLSPVNHLLTPEVALMHAAHLSNPPSSRPPTLPNIPLSKPRSTTINHSTSAWLLEVDVREVHHQLQASPDHVNEVR